MATSNSACHMNSAAPKKLKLESNSKFETGKVLQSKLSKYEVPQHSWSLRLLIIPTLEALTCAGMQASKHQKHSFEDVPFSLSFILIYLLKPCRMADEWVDQSLQIAFIRPLKMWRAEVAASGTPHLPVRGCLFCRNLGILWLCVVVPVPSWERSPASQFWLGHGQYARPVLSWNVGDLKNWRFDPSREMGKGTWWKWDDHGLWCSQQFCQIGPDQRPSPQSHPIPEPWMVHWGDGVVFGPPGHSTEPTHRHPPWHRKREAWCARAAGPSPDSTGTLRSEDADSCIYASLRCSCCCTPARENLPGESEEKRILELGRAAEKWVPATLQCIAILRGVAVHHPDTLWMWPRRGWSLCQGWILKPFGRLSPLSSCMV